MGSNATKGAVGGIASGAAQGSAFGPWGAAIGGVIGGISGLLQGGAADDAEELAAMQAKFSAMESEENLKRMREEADYMLGSTKVAVYAGNMNFTGTNKAYHNKQDSNARRDRAWETEAERINQRMIKKGGQAASDGIMNSMYASQLSQLGGAATDYFGGMLSAPKPIQGPPKSLFGGPSVKMNPSTKPIQGPPSSLFGT